MISKTALTYGGALYDLAREESLEEQILGGSSLVMLFAAMGLVSGAHGRAKPDWLR